MAAHALPLLTPVLTAGAVGWLYYRRMRRQFGWQRWQPRRTAVRIVVLSVVTLLLLALAVLQPAVRPGMAIGVVAGAGLAWLALKHTAFQYRDGVAGYTPHPWIGVGLGLLLLGRLAWRWRQGAFADGAAATLQQASPFTLGLAAMLVTYSLLQAIGLVRRMRRMRQAAEGG